jgi:hypothetical protein
MNRNPGHALLMALLALSVTQSAVAATVLFDFESASDLAAFHDEGRAVLGSGKTLERVERFATSGRFSLCLSVPQWRAGQPEWPAFEVNPAVTNWSEFDRLSFDVTNPGDQPQRLMLFVSDAPRPTRQGLSHSLLLSPNSLARVVVPLSQFAEKRVNPAGIRVMHFFTERPAADMKVFIDRVALLRQGEAVPAVPASYLWELAQVQAGRVQEMRTALAGFQSRLEQLAARAPGLASWAARTVAEFDQRISAFAAASARADATLLTAAQTVSSFGKDLARLGTLADFRAAFEAVRPKVRLGETPGSDPAVGFATSMEKILPRALSVTPLITNRLELSLARHEKESFQVLVMSLDQDLKRVQVRVGDLRSAEGQVLKAKQVTAVPVGYVQTKTTPPYGTEHVGWWPDPILDFLTTADVAKGDVQSFWVRVHAPGDQPTGRYAGRLELLVDEAAVCAFELTVRVYPFTVPIGSPLPLAITFSPEDSPLPATQQAQTEWRKSPQYPVNAWRKHKLRWADFLADYYITYDSLYHHGMPDPEVLAQLHEQGRLGRFNLGYYGQAGTNAAQVEAWKASNLPRFHAACDKARELGVLDHAYIYGCDEATADLFPQVQQAAVLLKSEFPDVMVMTTTYDQSYGMNSVIKTMDAFCPLTPSFDPAKAAAARAAGKQVWWYICCGPHHPHLNMFIEYPAIEGRLLMGAMPAKYRPDGFLYYQISIWNAEKPITTGPFTDWDARSWTTYHGDGSWTCVGPDGTPLPTIRLENFRDGLEDYAYHRLLESLVAKAEASPALGQEEAAWLKMAKPLLEVPADMLKSKTEFTRDPQVVYRYRSALAEAIVSAGFDPGK